MFSPRHTPARSSTSYVRVRARAGRVAAVAAATTAILLAAAAAAAAATTAERPALGVDRSTIGSSDAGWDAGQQSLRQLRRHAGARFEPPVRRIGRPGGVATDFCGSSSATGDVNGDGLEDLVFGCKGADPVIGGPTYPNAGVVQVLLRNATNTGFESPVELAPVAPIRTSQNHAEFITGCGNAVDLADVNGDGRDDVIVGCAGLNNDVNGNHESGHGLVLVYLRNQANTGFDAVPERLHNPSPGWQVYCGASVAAGDFNGDGRTDIATGCVGDTSNDGVVLVFLRNGSQSTPMYAAGVPYARTTPVSNDAWCGWRIAVGNINGDGRDDIAVACRHASALSGSGSGFALVRNATNTGFTQLGPLMQPTPDTNERCGFSIALGDVDGDGHDDVALGCSSTAQTTSGANGRVFVYRYLVGSGLFEVDGTAAILEDPTPALGANCGYSVAIGDANGDGRGDVATGCHMSRFQNQWDFNGNGLLFTRNEANTGFSAGTEHWMAPLSTRVDWQVCGRSITLGDLNADGRDDMVLGCTGDRDTPAGTSNDGKGYVYVHDATGPRAEVRQPSFQISDTCGASTAAGDVNGDGRDDVVVGCPLDDLTGPVNDAGSVVVGVRTAAGEIASGVVLQHPTPAADDRCGSSVAVADVDGDGRDDVIMGCARDTVAGQAQAGSVVVFLRNAANNGFETGVVVTLSVAVAGDLCGTSVAAADVTGDGRADLVLGCPGDDDAGANAGAAYLRASTTAGPPASFAPQVRLTAHDPSAGELCGTSVAAGDLDGNGHADVVLGCPDSSASAGEVEVRLYDPTGGGFWPGVSITHPSRTGGDRCGVAVALGDVDRDGLGDVVLGCSGDDGASGSADGAGSMLLARRSSANDGFDAAIVLERTTPVADDACGTSVAVIDVDGNGTADPVLGCPGDDTTTAGAQSGAGSATVFTRDASNVGFDAPVEVQHPQPEPGDGCGTALGAGDLDGDGLGDLLLGCPTDDTLFANGGNALTRADTGVVAPLMSVAGGISGTLGTSRTATLLDRGSPAAGDECGVALDSGDVNGDGLADLLTGCPGATVSGSSGAGVVVLRLRNATNTGYAAAVELPNPAPAVDDDCGASVAIGDVNRDGLGDLAFGCPGDDTGAGGAGSVVVHLRNSTNSGFLGATTLQHYAVTAGDACGAAIAIADANADGFGDLAIGCPQADPGAVSGAGSVVVWLRKTDNTWDTIPATQQGHPSAAVDDRCGSALAIGEFTGDELPDLAIGCPGDDTGGAGAGSVVTIARNSGNTGYDAGVERGSSSAAAGEGCGSSVALGDISRDQRSDLVFGCPGAASGAGVTEVRTWDIGGSTFAASAPLSHPDPGAAGACGSAVGIGDVDGDDSVDVAYGCATGGSGGSGSVVVARRSADAGGFAASTELTHPSAAAGDACGSSLVVSERTRDGRADVASGCAGDDLPAAGAGSVLAFDDRSTRLVTRRLNREIAVTDAQVDLGIRGLVRLADGSTDPTLAPTAEVSNDAGATWSAVALGASHAFGATDDDLRLRLTIPAAPNPRAGQRIHDLQLTYDHDNLAPDAVTGRTPGDGFATPSTTPTFTAEFRDPNANDTGTIEFVVCSVQVPANTACPGPNVVASGTSASGLAVGATGSWTSPALVLGTNYHWQARGTDAGSPTLSGPWSATRRIKIGASISIAVDSTSVTMSPQALIPGQNATASSVVTVTTDNATGYTLLAADESDSWGAQSSGGDTIPDWTGDQAMPTVWDTGGGWDWDLGYWGITVRSVSGGANQRLAKWGDLVGGHAATDFANNRYAGLDEATSATLHTSAVAAPGGHQVTTTYRTNRSDLQPAGAYTGRVTYTVIANP